MKADQLVLTTTMIVGAQATGTKAETTVSEQYKLCAGLRPCKNWKVDETDIGVVLGLKDKKLTFQLTVDTLPKKLEGYIKKELD